MLIGGFGESLEVEEDQKEKNVREHVEKGV